MKKSSIKTKAIVVWLMIIIFYFGAIAILFMFFNKVKAPEIRLKVTVLTESLQTHVYHVILYLKY